MESLSVHLKLIQHGKLTIFQLKKIKFALKESYFTGENKGMITLRHLGLRSSFP